MSEKNGEKSGNESTGSTESKDDRMGELQADISRLEERNESIRNDRVEYELKFQRAMLRGVSRVPTEPMKLLKHPVAADRDDLNVTSTSSSDTDIDEYLNPVSTDKNNHVKNQIRGSKNPKIGTANRKKNQK